MSLSKLWEMVKDREAWRAAVHMGSQRVRGALVTEQTPPAGFLSKCLQGAIPPAVKFQPQSFGSCSFFRLAASSPNVFSCCLVVSSPKRLPWPSYLNCHHFSLCNLPPCFVFHHRACHYRSFMFIYCSWPPLQILSAMRIRFCLFYSLLCSWDWEQWLAGIQYKVVE